LIVCAPDSPARNKYGNSSRTFEKRSPLHIMGNKDLCALQRNPACRSICNPVTE
jgi:hypothetical protein